MRTIAIIALSTFFSLFFYTASPALTTQEVLTLKQHGVSEETIQLMLRAEARTRAHDRTAVKITQTDSAVIYSTGRPSETPLSRQQQQNIERAWDMLKNLSIELQ
ncbi:MAG: hypothetical protein GY868_11045 [Deltaproteobacteria bacterium]|nr:hypothetical protein [Deltaproteobacteria bacterium]